MKKTISLLALILVFGAGNSNATVRNVTVANFSFTPSNLTVTVGDTIKWNWSNGSHTTTCDGSNGTTFPPGAQTWSAALNSGSPSFTYVVRVAGSYHYVCIPHSPDMSGNITANPSSVSQLTQLAESYHLAQNFPNPFNPITNIVFSIAGSSRVDLKIYDASGKQVQSLYGGILRAGTYKADWNAAGFPSGVYFYRLEAGSFTETRKMILLK